MSVTTDSTRIDKQMQEAPISARSRAQMRVKGAIRLQIQGQACAMSQCHDVMAPNGTTDRATGAALSPDQQEESENASAYKRPLDPARELQIHSAVSRPPPVVPSWPIEPADPRRRCGLATQRRTSLAPLCVGPFGVSPDQSCSLRGVLIVAADGRDGGVVCCCVVAVELL